MPRQPRLDAPGLLQHVMARGIEGREIFQDDKDRESFLDRLAAILGETHTQCYAWSLIPNHFHLLLRTGPTPLSKVMRRLMTGYAVTFNRRHKRSGHLFQNRYKSIVCEEDPYLLELIRYIHLNPLRASLVKDLKELDKYPWSGHSAILGRRKNPLIPEAFTGKSFSAARRIAFSQFHPGLKKEQTNHENPASPVKFEDHFTGVDPIKDSKFLAEKTIEDVLLHFGDTLTVARTRYRQFIKNGIDEGTRPELQGGGLIRSAGGNKADLLGRKKEEREKGDARILGSGDFVTETLIKSGEKWEKHQGDRMSLQELIEKVASHLDLKTERIISASRRKEITEARALVCHLAINDLSYSASEVARSLAISRVNAGRCAERGKIVLDNYKDLKDIAQ